MMDIKVYESEKLCEKYFGFTHSSGLKVYVFPKNLRTSYALFATKYGSLENCFKLASDNEFVTVPAGIAHFLEHKMFENEDGKDTFELFGKTGASANAYTSFDKTAYLFSSTDNFYESLEILLDFVTHPYFTPETVAKEQGIIAQEIQMYEDNPNTRVYYELMRALYKNNDVRTEIAGSVESIADITADLLYKCYNTFYNLNNMVLCVCGDVDVDSVACVLDKTLKKAPAFNVVRSYKEEDAAVFKKRTQTEMQVARPQFAIGVKDIDIPSDPRVFAKKDFGMRILNEILFSSSTDFFSDMYEKGILNSQFSCEYDLASSFAYCYYSGETDNPDEFYEILKNYIKECQSKPVDKDAFMRAKRTVYADFVRLFDSTDEIANELVAYALSDIDLFDNVEILDSIDCEYIDELLQKQFKDEYFALSVISPIK
ncbi:MAG: insulinase family protein [Clostridia bacterium]|nr:insulinase family protein [Clostridia bacterium]